MATWNNRDQALLAPHFKVEELACHCGCQVPPSVRPRLTELARHLETIRLAVGEPLSITSGYRCEAHNRSIGGASTSQHLLGRAADISSVNPRELASKIEGLISAGLLPEGGVGTYSRWVHYDFRGQRARWGAQ